MRTPGRGAKECETALLSGPRAEGNSRPGGPAPWGRRRRRRAGWTRDPARGPAASSCQRGRDKARRGPGGRAAERRIPPIRASWREALTQDRSRPASPPSRPVSACVGGGWRHSADFCWEGRRLYVWQPGQGEGGLNRSSRGPAGPWRETWFCVCKASCQGPGAAYIRASRGAVERKKRERPHSVLHPTLLLTPPTPRSQQTPIPHPSVSTNTPTTTPPPRCALPFPCGSCPCWPASWPRRASRTAKRRL